MKTTIIICFAFILSINIHGQTGVFPSSPRAQIETPIAINPTNPNNLIGAAITEVTYNDNVFYKIGYYYSLDAGLTWQGSEEYTDSSSSEGDPVVAFDPDGIAYIVYQVFSEGKLFMRISSDGGINWNPAIGTSARQIVHMESEDKLDRPCIAVSPIRNALGKFNVYISFTYSPFDGNDEVALYRSTNGGDSFQGIHNAHDEQYDLKGTYVETGPYGEIFLAWARTTTDRNEVKKIHVEMSVNEGEDFQYPVDIDETQTGGWKTKYVRRLPRYYCLEWSACLSYRMEEQLKFGHNIKTYPKGFMN